MSEPASITPVDNKHAEHSCRGSSGIMTCPACWDIMEAAREEMNLARLRGAHAISDPVAFWQSLTPAQALALLKAAPEVASGWIELDDGNTHERHDREGRWLIAVWAIGADKWRVRRRHAPSADTVTGLDEAKANADAVLRAEGWVLE